MARIKTGKSGEKSIKGAHMGSNKSEGNDHVQGMWCNPLFVFKKRSGQQEWSYKGGAEKIATINCKIMDMFVAIRSKDAEASFTANEQ